MGMQDLFYHINHYMKMGINRVNKMTHIHTFILVKPQRYPKDLQSFMKDAFCALCNSTPIHPKYPLTHTTSILTKEKIQL